MSAPNLNVASRGLAAVLACAALAACRPDTASTQTVTPKASGGAALTAPVPPGAARASSAEAAPENARSAAAASASSAPFAERLLAERAFGARIASDFVLGPLSASAEAQGAELAAHAFLGSLAERRPELGRLDPDYATVFEALHGVALRDLPAGLSWRLTRGASSPDGARIYAFALLGQESRSEGNLRLRSVDGAWLLASLDLDLSGLDQPAPERETAFDPDRFDWPE